MQTTAIPNTDLTPSALCMGTGDFGGGIDPQTAFALLDAFVDAGGTCIDTAKIYNDWLPGETSRSEKCIGDWLAARQNRARIVLATKGAHYHLETPHLPRLAAEDIQGDLEASLRHLRTETIDLYWLHRDDPQRPVEEILYPLHRAQQAGKLRWYGASNWRLDRLQAARAAADANGWSGFCAVQNMWSLAHIDPEGIADKTIVAMDEALLDYHRATGLPAIPFSSQANGLFHKLEQGQEERLNWLQRAMYLNPQTEQRLNRLKALKAETGLTTTQLVLGYLLSQPFPVVPVFSARSLEQLQDTLTAADVRLAEEQVQYLHG